MPTDDVATIAKSLTNDEKLFLKCVCDGLRLPPADRKQDRARQSLRRMGLVHVVQNPRRWEALPLGISVRNHLMEQEHD